MSECCQSCLSAFWKWCCSAEKRINPSARATGLENQQEHVNATDKHFVLLRLTLDIHIHVRVRDCEDAYAASHGFATDSTGARPWWGNLLLTSWIAHEPSNMFEGRKVIELGCGSYPLPSIVACLQGAGTVVATDGCQSQVQRASSVLSCNLNSLQDCFVRRLEWGQVVVASDEHAFDVVLFADVLYKDGGLAALLAKAITSLLRPAGEVIGTVGLHRSESSKIFAEMHAHNFRVEEVTLHRDVLSTALEAANCLNTATMFDDVNSSEESTNSRQNECLLVRWVQRKSVSRIIEPDMWEELHQKILNAHYNPEDLRANRSNRWVPTE